MCICKCIYAPRHVVHGRARVPEAPRELTPPTTECVGVCMCVTADHCVCVCVCVCVYGFMSECVAAAYVTDYCVSLCVCMGV
jgi:hypothetical protein